MLGKTIVALPLLGMLGTLFMGSSASAQVDVSAYPFAALEADWEHNDTWLEFQKMNSGGALDIPPVVNVGGGVKREQRGFLLLQGRAPGVRRDLLGATVTTRAPAGCTDSC